MKNFLGLLSAALLILAPGFTEENQSCPDCENSRCENSSENECCEERSPYQLPGQRAWPYDALLETPTTWPGKKEDSFYDWLTH